MMKSVRNKHGMPKDIRKSANYFKSLPKADPIDRPTQTIEKSLGENAIRSLLPEWANKPIDTMDDEVRATLAYLAIKMEHLLDSDEPTTATKRKIHRTVRRRNVPVGSKL